MHISSSFYMYLVALLCVCISCVFGIICLSVCHKIDLAGGPETFFNFGWPNILYMCCIWQYTVYC